MAIVMVIELIVMATIIMEIVIGEIIVRKELKVIKAGQPFILLGRVVILFGVGWLISFLIFFFDFGLLLPFLNLIVN